MKIHTFDSTDDAYDATQCDENIKDGDLLLIPSERVVGVAHTWPFAVSHAAGKLHGPVVFPYLDDAMTCYCDIPAGNIAAARALAARLGFDREGMA